MVNAWVRGNVGSHCSAERPLPGATSSGGTLQFVLVRYPGGYRIALGADEWELKPQTAFPVEINAQPVMRSDANAIAVTPKLVVIDLGADGKFMQKLAGAPMIEVKTAQAGFKLPLEGFADALSEVNDCYGTLRKAVSNPFAAPDAEDREREVSFAQASSEISVGTAQHCAVPSSFCESQSRRESVEFLSETNRIVRRNDSTAEALWPSLSEAARQRAC